jgi:hypothetical protein
VSLRRRPVGFLRIQALSLLGLAVGTETGAACRQSPQPRAPVESKIMADTITVSAAQPRAHIPLSRTNLKPGAEVLSLSVLKVHNPRLRPVGLAVGLSSDPDSPEFREIGHVALYPPDRPGRFALRVPAPVKPLLGPSQFLVIQLLPDLTVEGADDRRVTLGEFTWSDSEEAGPPPRS